jgi:hypothetical protein
VNQRIPFLEELKEDLLEHAPQRRNETPLPTPKRLRLSGAWVAAAVFIGVLLLGGLSWVLRSSAPTVTTTDLAAGLGPELEWTQVDPPEQVDRVRNLWSVEDGFALWTGREVWTSSNGETWELAAADPPIVDMNQVQAVARFEDGWIVVGSDNAGAPAIARTSDGSTWTSSILQVPPPPNELLASSAEVVSVANGPDGLVAVGAVTIGIDEDAVINRFAPDLSDNGGEIRYRDDGIEILGSDGSVHTSVPFSDIHDGLAEQGGALLDTIIWRSDDGFSWEETDVTEGVVPRFLGADSDRYVLTVLDRASGMTRLLTSDNSAEWTQLTELENQISGAPFALFESDIISGGPDTALVRIQPSGTSRIISTGPAFSGDALQDVTVAQLAGGRYGLLVAAYDNTREAVPYTVLWYSPNGSQWSRQDTQDTFGREGNLLAAVGEDRVVVMYDPQNEAGTALVAPLQIWIGTISN